MVLCLHDDIVGNVLPYFVVSNMEHVQTMIGVNISERKSGTERTKKRKKRELQFFLLPGDSTGTVVHRLESRRYTGFARSTIIRRISLSRDLRGPKSQLNKKAKQTIFLQTDTWHDQMVILYYEIHSFRSIDVPGCNDMLPTLQALSSTGSWLPSRLSFT